MKKILFFLLLITSPVFAQKVEHGILVGATLGFPMQDDHKFIGWGMDNDYSYNHNLGGGGMIGYRFRFLPVQKSFFDLDMTIGFQGMNSYRYLSYYEGDGNGNYETGSDGKSFSEFIMPISVAASYNYCLTDKFHIGVGVAPRLYVQPQAVFDLGVLAKIGYRVLPHCELALSYQYGCLNVLKSFNDGQALGRRGHLSDLTLSVYIPFSLK